MVLCYYRSLKTGSPHRVRIQNRNQRRKAFGACNTVHRLNPLISVSFCRLILIQSHSSECILSVHVGGVSRLRDPHEIHDSSKFFNVTRESQPVSP